MGIRSTEDLLRKIEELENRLAESDQLIEAIRAGEVDAFALNKNNKSEIFTLESGDYAYRILVENFNEGALNLSEDGLIVYTNNYLLNLLNLPYQQVIGSSIFQFIHSSSTEQFNEFFKKGLAGQVKGEINLSVRNKIIPVYISLTSLYPSLPTIGMIVTDLSEKKKQEKILRQKNEQLAKSNAELASFSYVASHDLQEPLRKIRTFSNLILEKDHHHLSEEGQLMFQRMNVAAERMQTLIQDLLTYSRSNTNGQKFENIHLNQVIDEIKEDLSEELKEKHATIETSDLCDISALPFQFRQLLFNLIGNSLKFSQPCLPPHITIKSEVASGKEFQNQNLFADQNYCHISISDNGIGFEPKYREKIFEVFQRLHTKDQYSGTGIGLSIVKRIVENHLGVITASGEINKGATFDIYIPK